MENRVVCIKPYESMLTVNKVYEVKRENDVDTIVVVGDCGVRYVMPRAYFIEVKVIKKVRYTKESCAYIPNMFIGYIYEVVEETKDGFYIVINCKRMTTRVPKQCFEEINNKKEDKTGEKVVCIINGGNRYNITIGREYEVVGCREQEYGVINNIGEVYYYPKLLFKQIEDKIIIDNGNNIPKKVVCVDDVFINKIDNITRGNDYEILDILPQDDTISIIDDFGDKATFHKSLFKPIKPNRNISVNLTFDTSELQDKLEKALYHLKELNKVMGEIGEIGKEDVKVGIGRL